MKEEARSKPYIVRRQVHLVGPTTVARRLNFALSMYPQLVVTEYATLEDMQRDQHHSRPDIVVAVLATPSWGGRLIAAEQPLNVPLVLAMPRPTKELVAFAQGSGNLFVEGPQGLGPRVASRVARSLGLAPRLRPAHDLLGPVTLKVGDRAYDAAVRDLAPHAVFLRLPAGSPVELGSAATLRLIRASGPLDLRGTVALGDDSAAGPSVLVRLDEASESTFAPVLWSWTEQTAANRDDQRVTTQEQWISLGKAQRVTVRVKPEGSNARHYFRLVGIALGRLRLASSGQIPALGGGATVALDLQTQRGPVAMPARVIDESIRPDGDQGEVYEVVVSLAHETPDERLAHERLLRCLRVELGPAAKRKLFTKTYDLMEAPPSEVDQFIAPAEFAQRHDVRLHDVTRIARRLGIGHRLDGRRVFREADMLDAMRHHLQCIRELRQRKLHLHVLAVDDDVENVEAIERILRKDYKVFTATTGEEALEIFKRESIEVIITDQRMPGLSGTDLLRKTLDIDPNAIRIILSAYTDAGALTEAINTAKAHHFLYKPIAREDLLSKVQAAFAALRTQKHVRSIELGRSTTHP